MENFTINVDLKSIFDDYRAKSVVFVDTSVMKKVKHVVHHIKVIFGIESHACVFSQDNFVPGAEDCRVLKSLPNIRLVSLSSPSIQQNNQDGSNLNDEHQHFVSVPNSEISNIDHDDHTAVQLTLKKKKHKRKRVSNDSQDHEYSANHQDKAEDLSFNSSSLFFPQDGKVREISNSEARSLYSDSSPKSDSKKSKKEETPNGAVYGEGCNLNSVVKERITKVSSEINGSMWTSTVDEADRDQVRSDPNTNADVDSKPKRKRVRKRNKAAKPEDIPQDTEISKPQPTFKTLKLSTSSSNHIFFPEEGQEELETPARVSEAKNIPGEDTCESVLLKCSDYKKGDLEEQELNSDANKGQEIKNQPSVSKDSSKDHDDINNESSVSENCRKSTGSDVLQAAITKPKRFSVHAERGLGKLLSLVRSDSPPVFERKKVVKPVQSPLKQINPVAVSPQAEQAPKSSSTSQNNEKITPLITIPEANTKISFKILKMSASYCPELSNSIMAVVKEVNEEAQELSLKLISGAEECKTPKGKFDLCLEATEEESEVDEIKLNWRELIEPYICP